MNYLAIKCHKHLTDFESIKKENAMMLAIQNMKIPENAKKKFLEYHGLYKSVRDGTIFFLIVMESGEINLAETLKMREKYSLENVLFIMRSLSEDFKILEENGVASRDVKPQNIILVKADDEHYHYKISDFGIGCLLNEWENEIDVDSISGLTKRYAAPELFLIENQKYPKKTYDPFKADVYSFAIMIIVLLGFKKKEDYLELKDNPLYELLEKMLKENPEERISFHEITKQLEKIIAANKFKPQQPKDEDDFIKLFKLAEAGSFEDKLSKNFKLYESYKELTHYRKAREFLEICLEIYNSNLEAFLSTETEMMLFREKAFLCREEYEMIEAYEWDKKYQYLSLKLLGEKSEEFANSLDSLSKNYQHVDNYTYAIKEKYMLRAMLIREEIFGWEDEKTVLSYQNLALFYFKMGETKMAEEYFMKVIQIVEVDLKIENENSIDYYFNLACFYSESDPNKAERYFKKALSICQNNFGLTHQKNRIILQSLGCLYIQMRNYEEASESFVKSLLLIDDHQPLTLTWKSQSIFEEINNFNTLSLAKILILCETLFLKSELLEKLSNEGKDLSNLPLYLYFAGLITMSICYAVFFGTYTINSSYDQGCNIDSYLENWGIATFSCNIVISCLIVCLVWIVILSKFSKKHVLYMRLCFSIIFIVKMLSNLSIS